jgi:hypothetical protein
VTARNQRKKKWTKRRYEIQTKEAKRGTGKVSRPDVLLRQKNCLRRVCFSEVFLGLCRMREKLR